LASHTAASTWTFSWADATTGSWQDEDVFPTDTRCSQLVDLLPQGIFAVCEGAPAPTVWRFEATTRIWETLPVADPEGDGGPIAFIAVATDAARNTVLLLANSDDGGPAETWALRFGAAPLAAVSWQELTPLEDNITNVSTLFVDDRLLGRPLVALQRSDGTFHLAAWDGAVWRALAGAVAQPPPRSGAAVAVDNEGTVWMFGGRTARGVTNELWRWAGTWQRVDGIDPPPPLEGAQLADAGAVDGLLVLFGGRDASGGLVGTWRADMGRFADEEGRMLWSEVTTPPLPNPRVNHQMLWYPPLDQAVMFGGRTEVGNLDTTLWTWSATGWQSLATSAGTGLGARTAGALGHDGVRLLFVGGAEDGATTCFDDVWSWTPGGTFQEIAALPGPSCRAAVVPDVAFGRALVFGGAATTALIAGEPSRVAQIVGSEVRELTVHDLEGDGDPGPRVDAPSAPLPDGRVFLPRHSAAPDADYLLDLAGAERPALMVVGDVSALPSDADVLEISVRASGVAAGFASDGTADPALELFAWSSSGPRSLGGAIDPDTGLFVARETEPVRARTAIVNGRLVVFVAPHATNRIVGAALDVDAVEARVRYRLPE
jgi:hypothetical protein